MSPRSSPNSMLNGTGPRLELLRTKALTKRRELDAVGRKLDGLIDAIARWIRSTSLQQKLDELEARKTELERALQAQPSPSSSPASEVG